MIYVCYNTACERKGLLSYNENVCPVCHVSMTPAVITSNEVTKVTSFDQQQPSVAEALKDVNDSLVHITGHLSVLSSVTSDVARLANFVQLAEEHLKKIAEKEDVF